MRIADCENTSHQRNTCVFKGFSDIVGFVGAGPCACPDDTRTSKKRATTGGCPYVAPINKPMEPIK